MLTETNRTPKAITETSLTNKANKTALDDRNFKITVHFANVKDKTEASIDSDEISQIVLEQVSPQPYTISYACLIIPRFKTHYLVGDLADFLYHQMRKICVSFGWKLEFIDVRPEYLQWIMLVPASTSPSTFMRTILQQTSTQIFEEFPRVRRENSSNDFWAPGYFVLAGMHPYPPEIIEGFIRQTRQQQGLPFD